MALYKESFLILLPFFICFIWYHTIKVEGGIRQTLHHLGYWKSRIAFSVLLLAVFGICILFILTHMGAGSGELGVSSSISTMIDSYGTAIQHDLKWYFWFGLVLTGILLTY